MPDYENEKVISNGFVASDNGYIRYASASDYQGCCYLYLNGRHFGHAHGYPSSPDGGGMFPVRKGDKMTIYNNGGYCSMTVW